jgi:hypothetical protein
VLVCTLAVLSCVPEKEPHYFWYYEEINVNCVYFGSFIILWN